MSGVSRVAPALPVYRPQLKRQQRLYVQETSTKINSIPLQTEAQEQLEFDAITDTINMIVCAGAGIVIAGSLLGLLIHYLGGWGLVAMAALGLAVWGAKGLWREWA